jgi:hypothetical protein
LPPCLQSAHLPKDADRTVLDPSRVAFTVRP